MLLRCAATMRRFFTKSLSPAKRLRLPFRADSLLGLIHTASGVTGGDQLARLGVTLHALTVRGSTVPSGSTLMRILLLAQFFPPDIGGEERHVFDLAKTLAERGHEVA